MLGPCPGIKIRSKPCVLPCLATTRATSPEDFATAMSPRYWPRPISKCLHSHHKPTTKTLQSPTAKQHRSRPQPSLNPQGPRMASQPIRPSTASRKKPSTRPQWNPRLTPDAASSHQASRHLPSSYPRHPNAAQRVGQESFHVCTQAHRERNIISAHS